MRTFEEFSKQVRESCELHARRKGYTESDVDGPNRALQITSIAGISTAHGIGEIIYKALEYLKSPRELLLVKMAGWCYIIWREHEK